MFLYNYLKANYLLITVFITGACVLVIEVVATRILSPYFGNTIYTFSSVIGVILTALSFGYYFGGMYADKFPKEEIFYKIIFFSGLATFLAQALNLFVLPSVVYNFSIIYGPLISSIILFIIPSFLLGTLSPFAIKLQSAKFKKRGIGNVSGQVFFYSTLGSILGSLICGFYLIPNFGVNNIMLGTASILSFIGIWGLTKKKISKKKLIKLVSPPFLLIAFLVISQRIVVNPQIVKSYDGVYEKISVVDLTQGGRSARYLYQDRSSSSAIYLDTGELAHPYSEYYRLYELINPDIKNALFIGGGAYVMPNALLKENEEVIIDVVEIEPSLYQLSIDYFDVKDNPRLKNYIFDGRQFLASSENKYDLIFGDAYFSIYSIPIHLTTYEFAQLTYQQLSNNGVFIANLIGDLSRRDSSFLFSEFITFQKIYPNSYLFAVDHPSKLSPQNFIFVGLKSDYKFDFNQLNQSGEELFYSLESKLVDINRYDLNNYKIFTDDYSPVESSVSEMIKRNLEDDKLYLNGEEMLSIINQLVGYGPRYLGSDAKKKSETFIEAEMKAIAYDVITQEWNKSNYEFLNIIARLNPDADDRILLGTHYDSKKLADFDKNNPQGFVPGANDSASGVAVLIELARYLSLNEEFDGGVDIVFFDGEEGLPDLNNNQWRPIGSNYFAENIVDIYGVTLPKEAIIVDMVCDRDLDIYIEKSSLENAQELTNKLFDIGSSLYPDNFHSKVKYQIDDDHTPLNNIGIPSMLLIDFDYPYFHTTEDKADKCSGESLEKVGKVLMNYLATYSK